MLVTNYNSIYSQFNQSYFCKSIPVNLCHHALEGDILIVDLVLPLPILSICKCITPKVMIWFKKMSNKPKKRRTTCPHWDWRMMKSLTFRVAEVSVLTNLTSRHVWELGWPYLYSDPILGTIFRAEKGKRLNRVFWKKKTIIGIGKTIKNPSKRNGMTQLGQPIGNFTQKMNW